MPLTVTASEARAEFPRISREVHDENVEVTVMKGSRPWVKIVPVASPSQQTRASAQTGTLTDDTTAAPGDGARDDAYYAAYAAAADEYRELFEELSK